MITMHIVRPEQRVLTNNSVEIDGETEYTICNLSENFIWAENADINKGTNDGNYESLFPIQEAYEILDSEEGEYYEKCPICFRDEEKLQLILLSEL